jgi:hypothetical protein
MKYLQICIFILLAFTVSAKTSDTLRIITHNRVLIVTDPSKGVNPYSNWGIFPGASTEIRKIYMIVSLGCPDSIPCAHWDYLDHIYIRKQGGVAGKSLDYELGRMLTPYGSIFKKDWNWSWAMDVTDFSLILRDSVQIEYIHSGYEPNSVGWSLSVAFEIITGQEVAEPISISRMWEGSFRYGDPADDIEKKLKPVRFEPEKDASIARLRIQHTGHGMDYPKGCSEFCPRIRDVKFDGSIIQRKSIWKECGDNPLFPQGGTWIYDRGNWCPGYLQPADQIDMKITRPVHSFDIDMEPYVADSNIQANESIASYLIQFKKPEAKYDVAIERIISPNSEMNLSRLNPVCSEPHIVIRNLGSETLKTMTILYGTAGFPLRKQTWHGSLRFNETTDIWLRGPINFRESENQFRVILSLPNGRKDEWKQDNEAIVSFHAPMKLPTIMIIQFRTNNHPSDNKISVMDAFGGIVFMREARTLSPNTIYYDTISLVPGCYELNLSDTAGNGLEFWFEPEQGYGFLRLLDRKGRLLHNFESDCGSGQHLAFSAVENFIADTTRSPYAFSIFPLRVKEKVQFNCILPKAETITLLIRGSENALLEQHVYTSIQNQTLILDVSHLKSGRHFLEVEMNGKVIYKKRFNKE